MFANLLRKLTSLARSDDLPVVRVGPRVWYLAPAGAEIFGSSGPDLDAWLASGFVVVVKTNPARTVYRVELPGATVFVKHCKISGPRAWGREVIRPPKAKLEFENALALRERGVAAIEPLAWGANCAGRAKASSSLAATSTVSFTHYRVHPADSRSTNNSDSGGSHGHSAVSRKITTRASRGPTPRQPASRFDA